jgi:putative transposase
MARLPRLVLPGYPYHVTQRGNRRLQTFFGDEDYALYRELLAEAADKARAEIWCYCLMPNHVHMIVVPADEDGLRRTFADAHRRYTGFINARHRWTGHLWQGRFGAELMRAYLNLVDSTGSATAVEVAQYHAQIFRAHGLPARTSGGAPLSGRGVEARISKYAWLGCW